MNFFYSSLIYTETFIQVLSTMLPEHTSIKYTNKDVPNFINIDDIIKDLKELREVFKTNVNEELIIPRNQWHNTRLNLVRTVINYTIKFNSVNYYTSI